MSLKISEYKCFISFGIKCLIFCGLALSITLNLIIIVNYENKNTILLKLWILIIWY